MRGTEGPGVNYVISGATLMLLTRFPVIYLMEVV